MKARYLISMLAALASPALVSAQAPDGGPGAPPPSRPQHESSRSDGRPDRSSFGSGEHHHHHHHRMMRADGQSGDPRERFMHVREAIQNLRAAGMNEEAERVEMAARRMREEFMERRDGDRRGDGDRQRDGDRGRDGDRQRDGDRRRDDGPPMQGRRERGNFAVPQGYDLRGQLERLTRDVQELRMEVSRMRDGRRDSTGPQGGPREFSRQQWGERRHGEARDGANSNLPPSGNARPPGGRPDGVNPPGPGPQANGPQGQRDGAFPRPEWRNHRGPNQDGGQPPAPPQGDRPPGANAPANEESLPDGVIETPAPAAAHAPAPDVDSAPAPTPGS